MKHVMLDLETFGTRPGVAIRSIGAIMFDLSGRMCAHFYQNITRASCEKAGLTVDPTTEKWWSEQPAIAQAALAQDQIDLSAAARGFTAWFRDQSAEFVWGHGASFDPPIWEAASRAVLIEPPWRFWNIRDTRTVFDLFAFDTRTLTRKGTYHNALDDAAYQVDCLAAALRKGRPAEVVGVFD